MKFPSLALRLAVWFMLATLLPLNLFSYLSLKDNEELLHQEALSRISRLADRKLLEIRAYLGERNRDAQILARSRLMGEALPELVRIYLRHGSGSAEYRRLAKALESDLAPYIGESQDGLYYDVLLVSPQGEIVYTQKHEADFATSLATGPFSQTHLAEAFRKSSMTLESSYSDLGHYAPSSMPAAFVTVPVIREGVMEGVIALQLDPQQIYQMIMDGTALGTTGESALMRRVGGDEAVFAAPLRSDPEAVSRRAMDMKSAAAPVRNALSGQRGSGVELDYDGKQAVAAWRYLPELGWGLVVKMDASEVFAPLYQQRKDLLKMLVVLLLMVSLAALLAGQKLVRRIREFAQKADEIAGGELGGRVSDYGRDEISALAYSFNRMADRLQTLYRTQEERIEERTRELNVSNEQLREEIVERGKYEQALQLYKSALDVTQDGFWIVDVRGNLQLVNQAAATISGYSMEEMVRMHISQLEAIERAPGDVKAHMEKIIAQGFDFFETRHLHKDGHEIDIEVTTSYLPDTQQFAAFVRDISDRKRIENELKKSNDRYDRLAANIPIGVYQAYSTSAGEIIFLYVSPRFCSILGLSADAVYADASMAFQTIYPDDLEDFVRLNQVAVQTYKPFEWEGRIWVNGIVRWVHIESQPEPIAHGECLWDGVVVDITERKKAEEELNQTKARYDYASEIGKVGTWDWHPGTGDLLWNDETFRLLGLAPGSVTPTFELFLEVVHPDDRTFLIASVQAALNERKPYTLDCRLVTGNDEVTYCHIEGKVEFDPEGKPVRMLGTIQDITERKSAEEKLRESEKRFRHLFESSPDPIWIIEGHQFVDCNQAAVDMLGYPDKASLKNTHPSTLSPERQPDGESSYSKAERMMSAAQEKGLHRFEWVHTRKDGSNFFAEVTLSSIILQGRPVIHCLWRDVTESKQAQIELQHKQDLLNEAQRLGHLGSWELNLINEKLTWSDEVYRIFELDPSRFSPSYENFLNVIHPEDRDMVNQAYTRSLEDKQQYDIVHRLRMADGRIKWVHEHCSTDFDVSGKPLRSVGAVQDITAYKVAEDKLRVAAVAFETDEAILVTDAQANIIRVNQAFTRITGYQPEEVLGKNPRMLSSGRMGMEFYAEMWKELLDTGSWSGEIWDKRKSGEIYPKFLTITALRSKEGDITEFVAMFSDITGRKKAEQEIHNLAFYDVLTGLPNRRLLLDRFHLALPTSERSHQYGAVLFLDMDKFKMLNDTLGHDYGDLLLLEVARRIQSCVRETDTVARLGGDEFVVLVEGISASQEDALQKVAMVAEKIRLALSDPYQLKEHEYHSSPSIGVCLFQGNREPVDDLLKHADLAMYQAKEGGRNAVQFFDPAMQQVVEARAGLEKDLRHAIAGGELFLYYQIQVDSDIRPVGAEALLRWKHPVRGMVSPAQFIPVAEDSTLILDIGQWVLDTACRQLAIWSRREQTRDLELAINVSARQFGQHGFVQQVENAVRRHGIAPGRLKLELTESVVLKDVTDVVTKMYALKAAGIKLSLDDFGTGYSSLAYLKKLPLDQIKIDQSFVRDATSDPNDAAMVKVIIDLAQNFRLNVIAEGVETAAQLTFLRQNGCMAYQGYFFGKPAPAIEFETVVQGLHEQEQE